MDDASSVTCYMACPTVETGECFVYTIESGITFPRCPSKPIYASRTYITRAYQNSRPSKGNRSKVVSCSFSFLAHTSREWYQVPLVSHTFQYNIHFYKSMPEFQAKERQLKEYGILFCSFSFLAHTPKREVAGFLGFPIHSSTTYITRACQ